MFFKDSLSTDNRAVARRVTTYVYLAALLVLGYFMTIGINARPLVLAAAATVLALLATARFVPGLLRAFDHVARRPLIAAALVGLLALVLNTISGFFVHMPIPAVRDEFSYLLNADTFASGRLTNETHPFWPHFDSEHIIHRPSYQSKYPPGQGLFLALGQVIFGHPVAGVWISLALACAATTWMLQAWLPPRWSLLGGLLLVANFELFRLWGQGYWGGAVAMLGGALLFGGLRRFVCSPSTLAGGAMGLGVVILAASRPYEGALASLPAAIAVCIVLWRNRAAVRRFKMAAITAVAVLVLGASGLGYYNYSITGNAFVMPYQVWLKSKSMNLNQALGQAGESEVEHLKETLTGTAALEKGSRVDAEWEYQRALRRPGPKLLRQFSFYIGIPFLLPIALLPLILRRRWLQFATATCVLVVSGVMLNGAAGFAHYTAPIIGLVMVIVMQGLRHLRQWQLNGVRAGATVAAAIAVFAASLFGTKYFSEWIEQPFSPHDAWAHQRASIQRSLESDGDRHLIFVRYGPDHLWHREWVYNGADIDSSAVVWARELSREENKELIDYFGGREVWLVQADKNGGRLSAYSPAD